MDTLTTHVEHRTSRLQHEADVRRIGGDRHTGSATTARARRIALGVATTLLAVTVGAAAFAASIAPDRRSDEAAARAAFAIVSRPIVAHN
jgi:hypothetical protein